MNGEAKPAVQSSKVTTTDDDNNKPLEVTQTAEERVERMPVPAAARLAAPGPRAPRYFFLDTYLQI